MSRADVLRDAMVDKGDEFGSGAVSVFQRSLNFTLSVQVREQCGRLQGLHMLTTVRLNVVGARNVGYVTSVNEEPVITLTSAERNPNKCAKVAVLVWQ